HYSRVPPDLHSFPTRRSSDLDSRLRAGLPAATAGAAVLIVAQRVATIRDADEIVVLDEGRVVGRGTHSELMESNVTYQEIVLSQDRKSTRLNSSHVSISYAVF